MGQMVFLAEKVVAAVERHSREVVLSYSLFLSHRDKGKFAAEKREHEKVLLTVIAQAVAEAVVDAGGGPARPLEPSVN